MKSLQHLGDQPAGMPLLADDVLEFHAVRLLLLVSVCGTSSRIDGLTKMAKLDFFVRYPQFFEKMRRHLGSKPKSKPESAPALRSVESSMVRFHYGPWDRRYYHILSYLKAKGLLAVERDRKVYRFTLTELGREVASRAKTRQAYAGLVDHMKQVKQELGGKAGATLKKLVYDVFGKEVTERPMGEVIE